MSIRSWITLGIRLVGLAAVLVGVYEVISLIEYSTSPAVASLSKLAKDSAMAGMFDAETLRPNYAVPAIWIGGGLLLMFLGGPITRLLFSGIESPQSTPPARTPHAP